ncbi:MAG: carboxypeptidase regulatory-like domain-containing protein, partial [Halothiobacillaceae bacterium]|nr:carboxypeptidase regulatory-like domain-containing protein [Halothiobacillaceae bacterium]
YSATSDSLGNYSMTVAAGSYTLTASATGFDALAKPAAVTVGATTVTNFALSPVSVALTINSLTASTTSFTEAATASIGLSAALTGTPTSYTWTQLSGPKVPLTAVSATSASVDTSALNIAAECQLVFQLSVSNGTSTATAQVAVAALPADMVQYPAENVQIGGGTTAVARFQYGGAEWCLFNIGTALRATPVSMTKGASYEVILPAFANGVEVVNYGGQTYALVATWEAGISVVNITDPTMMTLVNVLPVNFYMDNVTFTETGGSILYGNIFESTAAPIASLVSDGVNLYIADHAYGIHKTSLANIFADVREADGTLKIDQEVCTVQYAGERAWGGPVDLSLYGGKLFAGLGAQGMGIFDP